MRKHIYLLMLAVIGLFISCGSDDFIEGNTEQSKRIFTADTEKSGDTRTSLSPERNINWTEGDHIAIFDKCTMPKDFELNAGAGSSNGSFMSVTTSVGEGLVPGTELSHVIAVYPYGKDYVATNASDTSFKIDNVEIPAEQTYVENSFSQRAMPMVAVTATNKLKFKNAGALIKLNIKASAPDMVINKITLESRSEKKEVIAGKSTITVDTEGQHPSIAMKPGGSTMITLNCNNVKLSDVSETTFYLSIPAMNFVNGFVITIYDEAASAMTLKSKASDIKRNQILVMPSIVFKKSPCAHINWVDLGLPSGIKWADCNMGASAPEKYGNYYAWGEIETKEDYSEITYLHRHKDAKGKWIYDNIGNDISGNPKYDAARAIWGEGARIPNRKDWAELYHNCMWYWKYYNNVDGRLVVSNINGKSIFLPFGGYRNGTELGGIDVVGAYWTSIQGSYGDSPGNANEMYVGNEGINESWIQRYCGLLIRPVKN